MYEMLGGILISLTKWILGRIAKKKLSDKEFVEYITAYQKKREHAGQAALDWEEALKQAQEENSK